MKALIELKKECMSRLTITESSICCFVCKDIRAKRLCIHHFGYDKNSITYNKFENSNDGRLKYYSTLLDEIKNDPSNFITLCINCHTKLEQLVKNNKNQVDFERTENDEMDYILAITLGCKLNKSKGGELLKKVRGDFAKCMYCKTFMDEKPTFKEGYTYGFSVCGNCTKEFHLQPLFEQTDTINDLSKLTPEEIKFSGAAHYRDRERFRDSPCTWCGKKSIMRIRCYQSRDIEKIDEPKITASCDNDKHIDSFKKLVLPENNGKLFLMNPDGTLGDEIEKEKQ